MKLDLHRLRHLIAVAASRNFTRAAERLSITQPALSRSIATLEEDLGLRIFDRGRAGVFVTPAGEEVVAGAKRLVAQAEALEQAVLQLRKPGTGSVRFGMAPLVASIFLPRLLARIAQAYPGLMLRPVVRKAEDLLVALTSGQIEVCFIASPYLASFDHLRADVIGTMPIGLFARAGHPLTAKAALCKDDLRQFPFAASLPEFPGSPPFVASIVCDNYFLMKELMLTSDTVCLMSPLTLRQELIESRVAALELDFIGRTGVDLYALRLPDRTTSSSAILLLEHLLAILQDTTY